MKAISLLVLLILISCAGQERKHQEKVLQESLRLCYVESDSYTGMKGSVQGSMTALLTITPLGKVTSCKITQNDFKDPNLKACVCDIFKRSTLPNDQGKDIEISYPVNFKPVKQ